MDGAIFTEINNCNSPDELFELVSEYFRGQGFGGICYVAPSAPVGPYAIMHRGMPEQWMERYREQELQEHDPIPRMAFRLGHPARLKDLIERLPALNPDEQSYMEAFKSSGLGEGLVIPTYGPFGRPGLIGLSAPAHPQLLDEFDIPLAAAVAQQAHTRMELMKIDEPRSGLSPREREILGWLCRGKSASDIATILGVAAATVTTHIQRIYGKLDVNDRVTCCAKAMAHHYV